MLPLKVLFILLITISSARALAEAIVENDKEIASPLMVAQPTDKEKSFVVGLVLEFPIYSFYLGSPDIRGEAYVPSFVPRLGPQISWKGFGTRMTFSTGLPSREKDRRGESEQTNFLFNFYWKQFAVNLYYQYFKNFYVASPFSELSQSKPDRYSQLPDAEVSHFGINLYLKSDLSKYGLNTAFDQKKFKRVSGDGWIYVPFYRHWEIDLGSRIIKGSESESKDTIPDINGGSFDTLGLAYGYSTTYVKGPYFASGLISLGPGVQRQEYEDSGSRFTKFTLAGKLNGKIAFGKLINDYTLGSHITLDTLYSRIEGTEIYSTMASVEFYLNKSL